MSPRKARPVDLTPEATTSEAFLAVTDECMDHWRANVPGVLGQRDIESLHQLRVGVRRFRSALSLFARPLDEPQLRWLNDEIRERALSFGVGRDLDVFLAGPHAALLTDDALDTLRRRRERAYDTLTTVLASKEWADVWLLADRFRGAAPWGLDPDPPAHVTASAILERRWRRVVRRGALLRELTPTERHRVRIQAKKLRYGAQFFAGLYPDAHESAAADFADGLGELQDALGLLNDAHTDAQILSSVGVTMAPTDEQVLLEQAITVHERVLSLRPFWTNT